MKVTDFVRKDNSASFSHYRQGMFYFRIADTNTIHMWQGKVEEQKVQYYLFPIPVEDLGDATLNNIEKSIFLMRYIRKAIDDGTMVKA